MSGPGFRVRNGSLGVAEVPGGLRQRRQSQRPPPGVHPLRRVVERGGENAVFIPLELRPVLLRPPFVHGDAVLQVGRMAWIVLAGGEGAKQRGDPFHEPGISDRVLYDQPGGVGRLVPDPAGGGKSVPVDPRFEPGGVFAVEPFHFRIVSGVEPPRLLQFPAECEVAVAHLQKFFREIVELHDVTPKAGPWFQGTFWSCGRALPVVGLVLGKAWNAEPVHQFEPISVAAVADVVQDVFHGLDRVVQIGFSHSVLPRIQGTDHQFRLYPPGTAQPPFPGIGMIFVNHGTVFAAPFVGGADELGPDRVHPFGDFRISEHIRRLPEQPGAFNFMAVGVFGMKAVPVPVEEGSEVAVGRVEDSVQKDLDQPDQRCPGFRGRRDPVEIGVGFQNVQMGVHRHRDRAGGTVVEVAELLFPVAGETLQVAAALRLKCAFLQNPEDFPGVFQRLRFAGRAVIFTEGVKRKPVGVHVFEIGFDRPVRIHVPPDPAVDRIDKMLPEIAVGPVRVSPAKRLAKHPGRG